MKKQGMLMLVVLIAAGSLTFAACKPAFEYDEDAMTTEAKEIVDNINGGDYQAVFDVMTDEMQAALPADTLQASFDPILEESGAFVDFKDTQTSATTQKGVDYVVVVVSCDYEDATRIYTISLTTDMKLGGLYMK